MAKRQQKPVSVIPFRLNNIEDFLPDSSYPVLHPDSREYDQYWRTKTEECLYGIWGNDSVVKNNKSVGGYRWLPPKITFYTHHTEIQLQTEDQKAKKSARPRLRDVEWFIGYDISACDGLSGFEYETDYTFFRPVGKLERGEHISNAEKKLLDRYGDQIRNKYGKYKKYVDAREYLYQTRQEPMGKPQWLNENLDYMLLSTRRLGKSSIIINGVVVYSMCFNGATTLDEYFNQTSSATCVVGSGNSDKTQEFFAKFGLCYDHLRKNVGAYDDGKTSRSGAWWWKTTGSVLKENSFLTNSVKIEGSDGYTGPGSRLWHVSYANSPSKGAGLSANYSIVEEVGLTRRVGIIHAENAPAQKADIKFGSSYYIGTGGDFDTIEDSRDMFYHPHTYTLLPCRNLFVPGGADTARFIPATYYEDMFRDENGNQDIQAAFEDLMYVRDQKERDSTTQYLHHKASYPVTDAEIFVKYDGNSYPIKQLEVRLNELKEGAVPYSTGRIVFNDAQNTDAYWIEDFDLTPLMEMDDLGAENPNKEGCYVQYEPPVPNRPARKWNDRNPLYMVFVEPVRNDKGSSFVYMYVWKFWDYKNPEKMQNNVVMEWFGRYNNNEKNLQRAFEMAALYGCNIFAEINNDAIRGVAVRRKQYDWLQPSLGHVEGLEVNADSNHEIGFYVSPGMGPGLETLTNEMLRTEVSVSESISGTEYKRESVILAETLNSRMMCSQLIAYNRTGNFDAHDGLRLLAVWNLANKEPEPQYENKEADAKLLAAYKEIARTRSIKRARRVGIGAQ